MLLLAPAMACQAPPAAVTPAPPAPQPALAPTSSPTTTAVEAAAPSPAATATPALAVATPTPVPPSPTPAPPPLTPTPAARPADPLAGADVALGRALYQSMGCAACHGPNAEGGDIRQGGGPKLAGNTLSFEAIRQQVRGGGGGMEAFPESRLSDADLRHIVAWEKSLPR